MQWHSPLHYTVNVEQGVERGLLGLGFHRERLEGAK